ncbi:hypothetical protein MNBD_NITROSPINAE01-581 [hydrothermal vent metagenome]|uniref:UDP-2,4-diacetamido-2,4, 6-trideoxy-beta-L-altropyranose hydrolase n=1 Tax=hydrothermal vent metagenome TaxID=652676 RepID=A0A3B1C8G4_9ZZZZ
MEPLKTVFARVDASVTIGSGHVTRLLALAEEIKSRGALVEFICREYQGNLLDLIEKAGFTVHALPAVAVWDSQEDANLTHAIIKKRGGGDWLLVDRYGIDAKWDRLLRPVVKNILVVDDLANVKRDCDVLLNQNYLPGIEVEYRDLLPQGAKLLLGPQYALLGAEFAKVRNMPVTPQSEGIKRILVSFGGGDNSNALLLALKALKLLSLNNIDVDIVAGQSEQRADEIKELADSLGANLYGSVDNMATLTARADLVIGALGVSTWERMCLGVISIIVTVASVQDRVAHALGKDELAIYLGRLEDVSPAMLADAVNDIITNNSVFYPLREKGVRLVDGFGAKRVAGALG